MSYRWAFLPMVNSTHVVHDPAELQSRLAEDGYLYFEGLLPRDDVMEVRRDVLKALDRAGWIHPKSPPMVGRVGTAPAREGDDSFFAALDEVQRVESFHSLAHHERLVSAMQAVVGPTAFPHPLKIARLIFPDFEAISTPPHQDFPNNQGTPGLTATWVPLGDLDEVLGGLAILRGSHKWGVLPVTNHLGAGNRCAVLPPDLLESCRWVTTDFHAGDVLVFPSLTVHAALHNLSATLFRLSVDFRWQAEHESLTEGCLEPHFGRLSWDDIYEGWESTRHQYYWRDLDYEVTPFTAFELQDPRSEMDLIKDYLKQEHRVDARREQRLSTSDSMDS
jgi:ectoine hydroxylase-related dioxygenase (phytanoyl-CoA dioxygenase family)